MKLKLNLKDPAVYIIAGFVFLVLTTIREIALGVDDYRDATTFAKIVGGIVGGSLVLWVLYVMGRMVYQMITGKK